MNVSEDTEDRNLFSDLYGAYKRAKSLCDRTVISEEVEPYIIPIVMCMQEQSPEGEEVAFELGVAEGKRDPDSAFCGLLQVCDVCVKEPWVYTWSGLQRKILEESEYEVDLIA